ncbi:uncharacterized protein CLUP02_15541 [Colletotrichum lupini]|uniref:Uncharacterized protein n=1 Tax=Colletotrichum lupini TaxID=145971 RepID=A0A9Q8T730_9PEZI|nr:uncharacterized protein CLUP02_15541 [Colletotrichum lupini]UQC90010.1 hypothetical protein CLUP02_15541 [Colletotrichum lupini]
MGKKGYRRGWGNGRVRAWETREEGRDSGKFGEVIQWISAANSPTRVHTEASPRLRSAPISVRSSVYVSGNSHTETIKVLDGYSPHTSSRPLMSSDHVQRPTQAPQAPPSLTELTDNTETAASISTKPPVVPKNPPQKPSQLWMTLQSHCASTMAAIPFLPP